MRRKNCNESIYKKYRQSIITSIIIIVIIASYQLISIVTEILELHLYFGWKKIEVNNSFSFKIPGDWEQGEKNGLLYFYDPGMVSDKNSDCLYNDNILMFQSKLDNMFEIGDSIEINNKAEKNILSDNFKSVVSLSSTVNSLGTISGKSIISVDNITYKKDYIQFNYDSSDYLFYCWNEKIDEKTLDKIADSVEFVK